MSSSTLKIITASEGKVFKRISDDAVLGEKISFDARFDRAENYVEVEMPEDSEPLTEIEEMREALAILGVKL